MLVSRLCKIPGSQYIPKFEKISKPCKEGEDIWDVLGYYDYDSEVVYICEEKIQEEVERLLHKPELIEKLNIESKHARNYLSLVVKELVRLHEHAHAYLHTAIIENFGNDYVYDIVSNWYVCKEVVEPLTEFVVRSIIENSAFHNPFMAVFDEIDELSPSYYKKWREIEAICRPTPYVIPPLTKIVRSKAWNNWSDFYRELENKKNWLLRVAITLGLTSH